MSRERSIIKLMTGSSQGERSGNEKGWKDAAEVERDLDLTDDKDIIYKRRDCMRILFGEGSESEDDIRR